MKVGTDAVLLGASAPLSKSKSLAEEKIEILDIGGGTGVLSLMLAQRAPEARITAIEIDDAAAEECAYNFQNSPFSDRMSCIHSSLDKFLRTRTRTRSRSQYDFIISNPPFFPASQAEGSRKKARDSYSLPAEELIEGIDELLSADGQFSLIIPYSDEERFMEIAAKKNLHPLQILRVRGRKESKIVRSILHFRRGKQKLNEDEMHIEVEKRHEYSDEYLRMIKDFLLIDK